jgi:hypothetical protein
MELLIYSTKTEGAGERLLRVTGLLLPEYKFEICRSVNELSRRLRQPVFGPTVALLLASSKAELQDILSIRDLLGDAKIILIVPDANPDTLAKGHTLKPRFLTYSESDFIDVIAVLKRMFSNFGADKSMKKQRRRGKKDFS